MAVRVDYVVRETTNNLLRNLLLTFASIITFTVSLGIMGGAVLVKKGVDNAFSRWRNDVEFIVYMLPRTEKENIDAVRQDLEASPQVESISFVDTAATFKEFKKIFEDDPRITDNVKPEDLPQSFRVRPKNPRASVVVELGQSFENRPGVYKVEFAADAIRSLEQTFDRLSTMFLVLALVLLFASFLLIMFMIQAAVFAHRREIEVQRLVGATNWFIRIPFLLEGAVHAVIGWLLATLALVGLTEAWQRILSSSNVQSFFGSIVWNGGDVVVSSGVMLAVALAVGTFSSALAVGFYLKV